jgi:hypothetical protein
MLARAVAYRKKKRASVSIFTGTLESMGTGIVQPSTRHGSTLSIGVSMSRVLNTADTAELEYQCTADG